MSGLEDVVNSASATGVPDGVLEPIIVLRVFSYDLIRRRHISINGTTLPGCWVRLDWGHDKPGPDFPIPAAAVTTSANHELHSYTLTVGRRNRDHILRVPALSAPSRRLATPNGTWLPGPGTCCDWLTVAWKCRSGQLLAASYSPSHLRERLHRRVRGTGLRVWRLQYRPGRSLLAKRQYVHQHSALGGFDHCGLGYSAL